MYTQGLVSIIIPCYNMKQYLAETLDSVVAQSYNNWECIIIDDGSTDNTESIVKNYCNKDTRFKYIKQGNEGVSAARNNGIKQAKGEYILPLDGDDLIDQTYIQQAKSYLSDNITTKLVYCKADYFGERQGDLDLGNYSYNTILWENCIFCSAVYRHTDFNKTSGYNTNMKDGFEDWDFWLSFLNANDIVYQIPETLFHYRIRKQSRNKLSEEKIHTLMKQIYNNHIDLYQTFNCELIYYRHKAQQQRAIEQQYKLLAKQYQDISNNFSFKLGKYLTAPFRWLKTKMKSK